jgi:hypothetical protein
MVPLPQRKSSAGHNLSHPQQIRSGCLGWCGSLGRELGLPPSSSACLLSFVIGKTFGCAVISWGSNHPGHC